MPILMSQATDSCASNPCWGESICITLSEDIDEFKCICFGNSQGKYCQNQIKKYEDIFKPLEDVAIEEVTTDIPGQSSTTPSLSSTVSLLKTFVPSNNIEQCNHNTCQLGRCLENGSCECIEPAIGKYCERINECIFLKCIHVSTS
jgi:hypothetical protein